MKIFNPLSIAFMLVAAINVSCNSCDKRQGSEVPAVTSTTETEYNHSAPAPDTIATAEMDNSSSIPIGTSKSSSTTGTKQSTTTTTNTKTASKSGYSAADGTDAENSDGDMYTKNNKKAMPTGTSIQ